MPQENNYEARLEELNAREAEIRQRLRQIADERTTNMGEAADVYGVNATDVDLGSNKEREELQEELTQIIREQGELFEARKQDKISQDKQKRKERQDEINRNGKLQQAYKFFTYLDTATTQGYNLDGLTEDDVLNLYDDFMTKSEYEQIKNETIERAMKNDREIVIPKLKEADVALDKDYQTQIQELRAKADEIRQRLSQISSERTTSMGDMANVFGVNAADVDLGNNEERDNLQAELDSILDQIALLEGVKSINYTKQRKEADVQKQEQKSRKDKLDQAYKFFTYLDTATTQGYNLDGLTEDDVLNLYDDFMTKPEYEQVKNETIERAMKDDREIVIPKLAQVEKSDGEKQPLFSKDAASKIKDMVDPESLSKMMKQPEKAIVKYQKPEGVEETALDNIPNDAINTSLEEPKPSLFKRAKEWVKNNKKKAAMIAGAAVVLGVAIGAAIHYVVTGDASAIQNASQVDVGGIADQISSGAASDAARQAADVSSVADLISQANNYGDGNVMQVASNAYDALSGNMLPLDPSVQSGIPVSAFDVVNNVQVPIESLKDMSAEQLQNISVLMGDSDLSEMLKGVTDPNEINNIISSNISHAQGYTQIPNEVIEQLSQGGRSL